MEIAEVLTPRRRLACLTLDFETDYGARLGGRFDMVLALDGFNEVALHERENQPRIIF